jgi:hypothetical protein
MEPREPRQVQPRDIYVVVACVLNGCMAVNFNKSNMQLKVSSASRFKRKMLFLV